eukprot:gene17423-23725_t
MPPDWSTPTRGHAPRTGTASPDGLDHPMVAEAPAGPMHAAGSPAAKSPDLVLQSPYTQMSEPQTPEVMASVSASHATQSRLGSRMGSASPMGTIGANHALFTPAPILGVDPLSWLMTTPEAGTVQYTFPGVPATAHASADAQQQTPADDPFLSVPAATHMAEQKYRTSSPAGSSRTGAGHSKAGQSGGTPLAPWSPTGDTQSSAHMSVAEDPSPSHAPGYRINRAENLSPRRIAFPAAASPTLGASPMMGGPSIYYSPLNQGPEVRWQPSYSTAPSTPARYDQVQLVLQSPSPGGKGTYEDLVAKYKRSKKMLQAEGLRRRLSTETRRSTLLEARVNALVDSHPAESVQLLATTQAEKMVAESRYLEARDMAESAQASLASFRAQLAASEEGKRAMLDAFMHAPEDAQHRKLKESEPLALQLLKSRLETAELSCDQLKRQLAEVQAEASAKEQAVRSSEAHKSRLVVDEAEKSLALMKQALDANLALVTQESATQLQEAESATEVLRANLALVTQESATKLHEAESVAELLRAKLEASESNGTLVAIQLQNAEEALSDSATALLKSEAKVTELSKQLQVAEDLSLGSATALHELEVKVAELGKQLQEAEAEAVQSATAFGEKGTAVQLKALDALLQSRHVMTVLEAHLDTDQLLQQSQQDVSRLLDELSVLQASDQGAPAASQLLLRSQQEVARLQGELNSLNKNEQEHAATAQLLLHSQQEVARLQDELSSLRQSQPEQAGAFGLEPPSMMSHGGLRAVQELLEISRRVCAERLEEISELRLAQLELYHDLETTHNDLTQAKAYHELETAHNELPQVKVRYCHCVPGKHSELMDSQIMIKTLNQQLHSFRYDSSECVTSAVLTTNDAANSQNMTVEASKPQGSESEWQALKHRADMAENKLRVMEEVEQALEEARECWHQQEQRANAAELQLSAVQRELEELNDHHTPDEAWQGLVRRAELAETRLGHIRDEKATVEEALAKAREMMLQQEERAVMAEMKVTSLYRDIDELRDHNLVPVACETPEESVRLTQNSLQYAKLAENSLGQASLSENNLHLALNSKAKLEESLEHARKALAQVEHRALVAELQLSRLEESQSHAPSALAEQEHPTLDAELPRHEEPLRHARNAMAEQEIRAVKAELQVSQLEDSLRDARNAIAKQEHGILIAELPRPEESQLSRLEDSLRDARNAMAEQEHRALSAELQVSKLENSLRDARNAMAEVEHRAADSELLLAEQEHRAEQAEHRALEAERHLSRAINEVQELQALSLNHGMPQRADGGQTSASPPSGQPTISDADFQMAFGSVQREYPNHRADEGQISLTDEDQMMMTESLGSIEESPRSSTALRNSSNSSSIVSRVESAKERMRSELDKLEGPRHTLQPANSVALRLEAVKDLMLGELDKVLVEGEQREAVVVAGAVADAVAEKSKLEAELRVVVEAVEAVAATKAVLEEELIRVGETALHEVMAAEVLALEAVEERIALQEGLNQTVAAHVDSVNSEVKVELVDSMEVLEAVAKAKAVVEDELMKSEVAVEESELEKAAMHEQLKIAEAKSWEWFDKHQSAVNEFEEH